MKYLKNFSGFVNETNDEINEAIKTYVFHIHPRDEHGDHIPTQKKIVKIKRSSVTSAKDTLYKQYPSDKFFMELDSVEDSINEDVYYDGDMPALTNIFMKILWMRDQAHIFHWQTKSYARHIAFGEFYEEFIGLIDGIAEGILKTNQIQFGPHASMTFVDYSEAEADLYVQKIRDFFINDFAKVISVENNRGIHNLVDDVLTLIDSLQYKLTLENTESLGTHIDEATTSWAKMMKGVKSSETGPWSIVAIENNKVVGQKIDIRIKDILPAHFEAMRKEFPKAKIHIEDGTGMVVFVNESVANEAIDVKYWSDYNTDTSGQGKKEHEIKSKDFEDTFEDAVVYWNQEADGAENRIKGAQIQKIKKMAQEFFKKAGWISSNVIQAMIAQEA